MFRFFLYVTIKEKFDLQQNNLAKDSTYLKICLYFFLDFCWFCWCVCESYCLGLPGTRKALQQQPAQECSRYTEWILHPLPPPPLPQKRTSDGIFWGTPGLVLGGGGGGGGGGGYMHRYGESSKICSFGSFIIFFSFNSFNIVNR